MTENKESVIKEILKTSRFLWIGLILLFTTLVITSNGVKNETGLVDSKRISKKIVKTQSHLNDDLHELEEILNGEDFNFLLQEYDYFVEDLNTRKGYSIHILLRTLIPGRDIQFIFLIMIPLYYGQIIQYR
jgi:hypothetical protein